MKSIKISQESLLRSYLNRHIVEPYVVILHLYSSSSEEVSEILDQCGVENDNVHSDKQCDYVVIACETKEQSEQMMEKFNSAQNVYATKWERGLSYKMVDTDK